MKDPAFLFYYSDFIVGTMLMTNEEVGMYIRILCFLADKDKITLDEALLIGNTKSIPKNILNKLEVEDGCFYNARLREEKAKRKLHSQHQSENVKKRWEKEKNQQQRYEVGNTTVLPLVNVNEDVDINVNINSNNGVDKIVRSLFVRTWNWNPPTEYLLGVCIDLYKTYGADMLTEAAQISSEYGKRSNTKYLKGVCEGLLKKKQLDQIKDREKRAAAIKVEESKIAWDPETSKIFHDLINQVQTKTKVVTEKPINKDQQIRNDKFFEAVEKGIIK